MYLQVRVFFIYVFVVFIKFISAVVIIISFNPHFVVSRHLLAASEFVHEYQSMLHTFAPF
jgi:hypothetical protein